MACHDVPVVSSVRCDVLALGPGLKGSLYCFKALFCDHH